ncbi:MAG: hypothetical protein R3Y43_04205 [Alphaproteobacteria bacterium]
MGVSQREYARMRGCALSTVQKAIASGRIKLNADKTINPEQADIDWAQNTNPARAKLQEPPPEMPKSTSYNANAFNDTPKVSGGFQQVRTAKEYYTAMNIKDRWLKFKGELVERAKVNDHIFKLGRNLTNALLLWPTRDSPIIASKLNVDENELRIILNERIREFLSEYGDPTNPL